MTVCCVAFNRGRCKPRRRDNHVDQPTRREKKLREDGVESVPTRQVSRTVSLCMEVNF